MPEHRPSALIVCAQQPATVLPCCQRLEAQEAGPEDLLLPRLEGHGRAVTSASLVQLQAPNCL